MEENRPILILGGGINGAAIAREFALNQRPVCLVDTGDLGGGTTACSSRLIHGGLRYLEYGERALVRESLQERGYLLQLAPQFVRPLRICIPVARRWGGLFQALDRVLATGLWSNPSTRGLWVVRAGLWLYDRFAADNSMPRHAVRTRQASSLKGLDHRFGWVCEYSDAQVLWPERLVVAMLQDAQGFANEREIPFEVFPYHSARRCDETIEIFSRRKNSGDSRADRVVRPLAIINATGAWVDATLSDLSVACRPLIGGTRGSHFVTFDMKLRECIAGCGVYAEATDGRPIFVLPFGRATLVGTTDVYHEGDPGEAIASEHELEYLLDGVNRIFPDVQLTRQHIDMHYCGVRPLPVAEKGASPGSVTRRHSVTEHDGAPIPVFSVVGGKLTTCRSLAEELVEQVSQRLSLSVGASSRDRPLPGSSGFGRAQTNNPEVAAPNAFTEIQVAAMQNLWGTAWEQRIAGSASNDTLCGTNLPVSLVRWVIRKEWVTHLADLVERRLMLLYQPEVCLDTLQHLSRLMVEEGLMSNAEAEGEVVACRERLKLRFGRQLTA